MNVQECDWTLTRALVRHVIQARARIHLTGTTVKTKFDNNLFYEDLCIHDDT